MEYVLKTNALCKNYKNFKALNGLTMNVPVKTAQERQL